MVVVKIEYEGDIRRITLEEGATYSSLLALVAELFRQSSLPQSWVLKYKDEDGDFVSVTSDREFAEALVSAQKTLLRFYVKAQTKPVVTPIVPTEQKKPAVPSTSTPTSFKPKHAAICDNCDQQIVGIRFKCAICPDYDLCEKCEALNSIHRHHSFARIFSPVNTSCCSGAPPAPLFKAGEPEPVPKVRYHSRFVKDVSVEDGSKIAAGSKFVKTWRMRNNGHNAWPEGTTFVNIGGDFMGNIERVPVKSTESQEEVDISVEIEAPRNPGRYVSNWRLSAPCGTNFGHKVWVDIIVEEAQKPEEKEKEKEVPTEKKSEEPIIPPPVIEPKKEEVKEKKVDDDIPEGPFRQKLIELYDMGFADRSLNRQLLVRCKGDILATVHELLKL